MAVSYTHLDVYKRQRSVSELLDGPGIQLSELAAKIQQLHIFFSLLIPVSYTHLDVYKRQECRQ